MLHAGCGTGSERWRMKELLARFGRAVKGVLTGFDRIVFKGTILPLAHVDGAMSFLGFLRRGNKFLHIEDYALAQRYLRQQLDRQWPHLLNSFLPSAFPTMKVNLIRPARSCAPYAKGSRTFPCVPKSPRKSTNG